MPSPLQYPLERERDIQRRWGRLLQRTVQITPPRDPNDDGDLDDDDEEENEKEDHREPAVIREPDEDE